MPISWKMDYDGDYRYEGRPITLLAGYGLRPCRLPSPVSIKSCFPASASLTRSCRRHSSGPCGRKARCGRPYRSAAQGCSLLSSRKVTSRGILRTTRAIYNERRLAFLEEAKILGGLLEFEPAIAGMHVTGLSEMQASMIERLRQKVPGAAVPVDPLSKYGATDCRGLVFGYAGRVAR